MPWTCPGCGSQITHSDVEAVPRSGFTYRCYFCHVTLVVDVVHRKLVIAAAGDDHQSIDADERSAPSPQARRGSRRRTTREAS
jgi:hypothetical protein